MTTDDWNTPEWDTYISQFEPIISNEDYIYVRDYLRELQAVNSEEVYCFYIVYLDPNLQSYVYLVDNASDEEMWSPGTVDHINQEHKYLFDPNNTNEDMAPVISDQPGYGYLCTAGAPIKIGNEIIGYATVDLSMTVIRAKQVDSIIRLFIYLVITMVLLIVVALIVIHFWLNRPLKQLIDMTKAYDVNDPEGTHKKYQEFSVKSHDELEDLAESMKQLENDVYTTINELKESNKQLVETQQVATEMTELANKDGLTGVRNKVSYDAEVKKIDKNIKEKIPFRLGIAMIDLNYLKIINDEYGHRSGDAALIKLSNLICTIFAHSPVYRIGGDEFVVLLRNIDFDRADILIAEFNAKIEGLSKDEYLLPAERISAAIGYSIYNPETDNSVDDIFKRADQAMYQRKHEMKGER